jgi:hypothetical protein
LDVLEAENGFEDEIEGLVKDLVDALNGIESLKGLLKKADRGCYRSVDAYLLKQRG